MIYIDYTGIPEDATETNRQIDIPRTTPEAEE